MRPFLLPLDVLLIIESEMSYFITGLAFFVVAT